MEKIEDENKSPRKKNDIIFKGAFEDYFAHLLRFLYIDAEQIFDFNREIIFINKELAEIDVDPQQSGGTRNADLLAKVFLLDGTEKWFLLHIEIQAVTKEGFSVRMFEYYYRLRDKYGQSIISLAIFTGKKSQLRPNEYKSSMYGTEVIFRYHTYQIFDHTEEELLLMKNPFAFVIAIAQQEALSEKTDDETRQTSRIRITESLAKNCNFSPVEIKRFVRFLNRIIIVKNPEYNLIFDQHVKNITGGLVTMGITETLKMLDIEEGIEIGIEKGRHEEALEVAREMKADGEPIAKIVKYTRLAIEKIEAL